MTLHLRVFYSAVAAVLSWYLHPDPALIHSNAFTENLPAPGNLHYALLGIWERFDTLWYVRIAQHGYDLPAAVIFHPLYPATIRAASWVLPPIAAALVVSTIGAFLFLWGLLRLAEPEMLAWERLWILLVVSVWPTNFILFAGYAESLTVALIAWAVVFARDKRWWPAAACGFLAGLGRPSGVLVSIPLFLLAWKSRRLASLAVLIAPLGTLGYWGWLRSTGHPSVVTAYRLYWSSDVVAPWTTLWRAISSLVHHPDAVLAMNLMALGLFILTGIVARRRIEDRCFSAAVIGQILLRLCDPLLLGTPRYLLPAYPSFLTMATVPQGTKRRRFAWLCAGLFVINLAWMVAFLNWSLVL